MAQTGLVRERTKRKHLVEAREAAEPDGSVSWPGDREQQPGQPHQRIDLAGEPRIDTWVRNLRRDIVEVEERAAAERERDRELRKLLERRYELLMELEERQRDRIEAERKARQVEQRVQARERHNEVQAAKVVGPRRGRPVRVEVDPEAWAAVKREAVRRRLWLVWWIRDMVRVEVDALTSGDVDGTPSSRRRRSPAESEPLPRRRFARIDVDDEHWLALRAAALDAGLPVGRYLGEIVEAAAYDGGWRAAPSFRREDDRQSIRTPATNM